MSEEYTIMDGNESIDKDGWDDLIQAFVIAANAMGYESSHAEVVRQPNLSVKWVRDGARKFIRIFIPDYLAGIPQDVALNAALHIMLKIDGRATSEWPENVLRTIRSQEFAEKHQRTYMERNEADEEGIRKALETALKEAEERGCTVAEGITAGYVDSRKAYYPMSSMRAVLVPRGVKKLSFSGKVRYLDAAIRYITENVEMDSTLGWVPNERTITKNDEAMFARYIAEGADWLIGEDCE